MPLPGAVTVAYAADAWNGTAATDWYDSSGSKTEFTIDSAADLAGLAQLVNGGNTFEGKTVKLAADIDLGNKEWTPIGKSGAVFKGTFDGGEHTISNLYINKDFDNTDANCSVGLFGYTNSPAVIKNVDFLNVDIQGSLYVGTVVGYGYTGSVISNCHVSGKIMIDGWWYIGGIGGNGYVSTVSYCSVSGDEGSYIKANNQGSYVGGIWGYRGEGDMTISDCTVKNLAISGMDRTGGICGIAHYGNTIQSCAIADSTITTDNNVGNTGLIAGADLSKSGSIAKVLDCTVTATIATSDEVSITTKVGSRDNDGNAVTTSATVGTDVTFDNTGKVTGGLLEQVDDSMIASGLQKGAAAADGTFELVPTDDTAVAKVGHTYYFELADAFAALNENNYSLTLLDDNAWTGSSIYWQAGTKSGYAASLKAAVEAASAAGDAITLVCKPDANDITDSPAHINVTKDITIYANGAEFGGDDLSIGTYEAPENTPTTVNIYCAKNLVVWGGPTTREDVWNVNFIDCENDGWNLLMYRGDENGKAQLNLTLTNCKASKFNDSTIHTTADGSITITGCTFTDNCAPVNIAHKQAGTMEVVIENSSFAECGSTSTANSLNQYAAPIRFVNNGTGTLTAVVDTVTITKTVGDNGDILLGDGRTGKTSTLVSATITGTYATVQIQQPGDWANGTLNENVAKHEVTASSGGTFSNAVAQVGEAKYISLAEAINAAVSGDTVEVLADSTVDSWHQTSQNLTGVTINGNGHTLTVTDFTPATLLNGLIASYGSNKISDLTIDLSGLTGSHKYHSAIVSQNGDVLDSVEVIGPENIDIYGVFANGSSAENELITIQNCEFTDCWRGVSLEPTLGTIVSPLESLKVEGCTFTDCDYIILYAEDTDFTGNTVDSGELNIMHGATSVTDNKFVDGTRVQFFASPEAFERNSFDATSYLEVDKTYDEDMVVDVSENYWGGGAPSGTQVPDSIKDSVTGTDVYYVRDTMNPSDLNTYVPPTPAPTSYSVAVAEAENGKVSVSATSAAEGDTVTVTATPAEGYEVASVAVTSGNQRVDVTDEGDGTYTFEMPAADVTVAVAFEASAPAVELPFTDVAEGDWYRGPVAFVYANRLMTGYEGTTLFGPEDALGREQAAMVLFRALAGASQAPAPGCGLADVDQGAWYAQAVNWAVDSGLLTGYGDGSGLFGVGDALTRDQFAAIVARVAKADLSQADPAALDAFSDGDAVAEWAVPAVSWAAQVGILEGSDDGEGGMELRSSAEITRGEMATMIMRAAEAGLLPTA